jgi:prepilin-type N-terminal cleavage/methylation domain-containing protein
MHPRGFTLLEVLLSITLIGIISGIGAVVYQQLQNRNDLDMAAASVARSFRRAQALSQAIDGDTTWGVRINTGSITLFQGASYATRVTSFDEVTNISSSIAPAGFVEAVFSKLTGLPQSSGTLTLTGSNDSRTITLNAQGTISY